MHHYGEKYTRSRVARGVFEIQCRNHVTGAVVTLSGPVRGVFETDGGIVDEATAQELGRRLAEFLRENMRGPASSAPREATF
jgi:hypothetical protein